MRVCLLFVAVFLSACGGDDAPKDETPLLDAPSAQTDAPSVQTDAPQITPDAPPDAPPTPPLFIDGDDVCVTGLCETCTPNFTAKATLIGGAWDRADCERLVLEEGIECTFTTYPPGTIPQIELNCPDAGLRTFFGPYEYTRGVDTCRVSGWVARENEVQGQDGFFTESLTQTSDAFTIGFAATPMGSDCVYAFLQ